MVEEQREKIYDLLANSNDDSLWHPNESPNTNTVIHLYQSGEISHQKGGQEYRNRSEFILKLSIGKNLKLDSDKFKHSLDYNSYGRIVSISYVIVTLVNANLIREEMIKLSEMMKL